MQNRTRSGSILLIGPIFTAMAVTAVSMYRDGTLSKVFEETGCQPSTAFPPEFLYVISALAVLSAVFSLLGRKGQGLAVVLGVSSAFSAFGYMGLCAVYVPAGIPEYLLSLADVDGITGEWKEYLRILGASLPFVALGTLLVQTRLNEKGLVPRSVLVGIQLSTLVFLGAMAVDGGLGDAVLYPGDPSLGYTERNAVEFAMLLSATFLGAALTARSVFGSGGLGSFIAGCLLSLSVFVALPYLWGLQPYSVAMYMFEHALYQLGYCPLPAHMFGNGSYDMLLSVACVASVLCFITGIPGGNRYASVDRDSYGRHLKTIDENLRDIELSEGLYEVLE